MRASGGGRRGGARALTPFVGREEELATLARRWERARAGEGQFVQIVGEPGLGKSRLMEEFRARLGETPHTWVEWASSQLLQNTPLHPIAEWGRQRFGGEDVARKRLADLEPRWRRSGSTPPSTRRCSRRCSIFPARRARAARARGVAAAATRGPRRLVLAGARAQPLVLAFEDLHWADPTSLDLLQSLADRGGQAPLLIVATTRPEFHAPWTTRSHHGVSRSRRSTRRDREMVAAIAERHALSRRCRRPKRAHRRRAAVHRGGDAAAARRAAHRRSRRRCNNRSPPGSIGSARRAKSRRSARCLAASSRYACCTTVAGLDDAGAGSGAGEARRRRFAVRRGRRAAPTIASSTR